MIKIYIIESLIDAVTWKNFNFIGNKFVKVDTPEEADCYFFVDNYKIVTDKTKKKILYLSEPYGTIPLCYDLLHDSNFTKHFDHIATCHTRFNFLSNGIILPPNAGTSLSKECFNTNKTKLASMIFSDKNYSDGHKLRHELKKIHLPGTIDGYGKMFNNPIENKEEGLKDYCFNFAIENCKETGYFTEKINDCMLAGTIPIYWGDPDIGNTYDINGIIDITDFTDLKLSFSLYKEKEEYVLKNYQIAKNIVKQNTVENTIDLLLNKIYYG